MLGFLKRAGLEFAWLAGQFAFFFDDSANGNWTYTYDDFDRLIGANQNSGQAVYSYAYDRFTNRWQQNGPHTMLLTFSGANNRMDGYSYDADGNVLNDGVHSYAYDAENRIISVDGGSTTYVYDANGQRVRKTVGGASTDYAYDLSGHAIPEVNASGLLRGEVYAGGRHIATYVNNTTYFDHGDWLGTERVRTAVNGSVCESTTSLPFGDGQSTTGSCADASTRHFTGKERDSESGNDYFGARYFASTMGRFLSPDWAAKVTPVPYAKLDNPQSLNLYSYVWNNPLRSNVPHLRIAAHRHLCGFDQQHSHKPVPLLTDRPQPLMSARTVLPRNQPQITGHLFAARKTRHISQRQYECQRSHRPHARLGHQQPSSFIFFRRFGHGVISYLGR